MRVPVSWLGEYVALGETSTSELAAALTRAGLLVERVETAGGDVSGPIVLGRVLSFISEPQKNGKTIRWCRVDVGVHNEPATESEPASRGIVCGANNFEVGDWVVVALPGATLPGNFQIAARKTYGHISEGMMCAADELGLGHDHSGIITLGNEDGIFETGIPAGPVLGLGEQVLEIDVTPDLGYCLSIRGVAREAAQALGVAFTDPLTGQTPPTKSDGFPVRSDSAACSLFVALSVTGVDPATPTPVEMVRRLELAGMRSISLPVDVTNYVMLETGQPLHAYAAERMTGGIVVREALPGETLMTLDGIERTLTGGELLITDGSGPIGLAGVMGGESTEIRADTRDLVLEAAAFDAVTIARAARKHKLSSEAARRFERGVDPAAAYPAAHRAARMLAELGGGTVQVAETVCGAVPEMAEIEIDGERPELVLGHPVKPDRVVQILRASGCAVTEGERLTVVPPSWRPDLREPADLVEEVGRKTGLDLIAPQLPTAPLGRGLTVAQKRRREVGHLLAGLGFVEVLTLPFVGPAELDALGWGGARVRLVNPLTEERPYLRPTLLAGLIDAAVRNASRGLEPVALFEIGRVVTSAGDATDMVLPGVDARPSDEECAAIAASRPTQPRSVGALVTGKDGLTRVLGAVEAIMDCYGVPATRTAAARGGFHPGRCAEVKVGQRVVGVAGELHPSTCEALALPTHAAAFELDLEMLLAEPVVPGKLQVLSTHPVAKEDVALIVDAHVSVAEVAQALRDGGGQLLESVELFDEFTGPQIGEGKRSLAFALLLRAGDHTLKQEEASAVRDAAVACACERVGAVQRV